MLKAVSFSARTRAYNASAGHALRQSLDTKRSLRVPNLLLGYLLLAALVAFWACLGDGYLQASRSGIHPRECQIERQFFLQP